MGCSRKKTLFTITWACYKKKLLLQSGSGVFLLLLLLLLLLVFRGEPLGHEDGGDGGHEGEEGGGNGLRLRDLRLAQDEQGGELRLRRAQGNRQREAATGHGHQRPRLDPSCMGNPPALVWRRRRTVARTCANGGLVLALALLATFLHTLGGAEGHKHQLLLCSTQTLDVSVFWVSLGLFFFASRRRAGASSGRYAVTAPVRGTVRRRARGLEDGEALSWLSSASFSFARVSFLVPREDFLVRLLQLWGHATCEIYSPALPSGPAWHILSNGSEQEDFV